MTSKGQMYKSHMVQIIRPTEVALGCTQFAMNGVHGDYMKITNMIQFTFI